MVSGDDCLGARERLPKGIFPLGTGLVNDNAGNYGNTLNGRFG